jgi:hypothetical protein
VTWTGYAWSQISGPPVSLQGANTAGATFTAPSSPAALGFSLTVTGPAGSSTQTVVVQVVAQPAVAGAVANPASSPVGNTVTLDGTGSTGTASYQWTQTGGSALNLTGATTAKATFVMPTGSTPLTFTLTVTGQDGTSSSATVQVSPVPDNLTVSLAEMTSASGPTGSAGPRPARYRTP